MTDDPVSSPKHYAGDGVIECRAAMRSMMSQADVSAEQAYWWGCVFKYLWRWPHKGHSRQDLEKAKQCIDYLLETVHEVGYSGNAVDWDDATENEIRRRFCELLSDDQS